jgi:hypothetical protein
LSTVLAVVLGVVALAALFFVVAGISITLSGMRARRGVVGDIALTGFFALCFVLAAGGCALIALPDITGREDRRLETPRASQQPPEAEQPAEQTEEETTARPEPAAPPDPSLAFDCEDFATQEAAQKALDGDLEDPDVLDPDADGTACEGLDDPDTKPKPDLEKSRDDEPKPDKESKLDEESRSKEEPDPERRSVSEKRAATEEGENPQKERQSRRER